MSTSLAYHTQGINGFQHHSFQFSDGKVIQRLKRKEFRCPKCSHCSISLSQMFPLFCQYVSLSDKTYSGLALWKDASLF